MVQICISSRKQHSSRLALMKCCEAVLRESRDLLGTVTQRTAISCHHCCVTLNYSHKMQLIPHWCQAGITQLVWKLWLILFTKSRAGRADLREKPGHLGTAALVLCHCLVADRVSTLTPAVQTKTSLPSWTIYQWGSLGSAFCVAPPELQTALCLWQLHIHHSINRKAKPLHVLISTLITLKQNSEFTRPFSYRKLVLVTLCTVGEASSLSIF